MKRWLSLGIVLVLAGCSPTDSSKTPSHQAMVCDPDLELPEGFCAEVFHPGAGKRVRHLAVRDNGDVFYAKRSERGGLFVLRDSNADGQADQEERWSDKGGTAVVIHNDHVYFSTPETVMRFTFHPTLLTPESGPEIIVDGYPDYKMHASKALALDAQNNLYVNVGAPSNACQEPSRTAGVPGQDPCPLLKTTSGVWRFSADKQGQAALEDGVHYATGIRNGLAMAWNQRADSLYLLQHGRDQLSELWPDLYTDKQRSELPAEQFFRVEANNDFGWPYCYYDHIQGKKVLNPEYGGDGKKTGRCTKFEQPIAAYPGHWAPNDLVFYQGKAYPERYQDGAFIAFHGSWNRAPFPQEGFRVVFQPFEGSDPSGDYETFINGFAQNDALKSPGEAKYRPTGLAVDKQGQLWVSDSREGRIWRVVYRGK